MNDLPLQHAKVRVCLEKGVGIDAQDVAGHWWALLSVSGRWRALVRASGCWRALVGVRRHWRA